MGECLIHFSSLKRSGDDGRASNGKGCTLHSKAGRGFTLFLMAVMICSMAFAGGCGDSSQEGTTAQYNPEADKARLDAMREGMKKSMTGLPGQGPKSKK